MKSLILAAAAVVALGTGSAFAAGTVKQNQNWTNGTQRTLSAQSQAVNFTAGNSGDTAVQSGPFDYPSVDFPGGN